ncbi:hypothetical protein [Lacticaseibacillus nasuensis]|nr:hypothetical protein [Lacticaseibacillus nasuensis]
MTSFTMTYPLWARMETMSARWMSIVFVLGAFLLIVLAMVATAVQNPRIRRWGLIGLTGSLLLVAGAGGAMYWYIQPYLRLNKLVTPRVRVKRAEFSGLVAESGSEISNMAAYNDYPDLDKLPMYDRSTVTWPVTYKGKGSGTQYFVIPRYNRLYAYTGRVEYTNTAHAYLKGYRYTLNDRRYAALGFINPSAYSTVALVIPKAQKKQTYDLQIQTKVYQLQTGGINWTSETVHRVEKW